MLPSTGLFRNIPCPLYGENECTRPFCHFLHAKRGKRIFKILVMKNYEILLFF